MNIDTYRTVKAVLITIAITLSSLFAFSFLREQNRIDNEFFCDGAPIVVENGDTLFWIARENCIGNFMNVVDKLVNAYGASLNVGDTVYLPVHNKCDIRITDGGQVVDDCS
jgi:hypothetical protein